MSDFIRARRSEQKKARLEEIKKATEDLFSRTSYHEISMSTIANELDWSRGNLYRYASSKEEIFLEIAKDKEKDYYNALNTVFVPEANYSLETLAQVWTGIINSHLDYLKYFELLPSIIETNVSLEKLVDFKKSHHSCVDEMSEKIGSFLGISQRAAYELLMTVQYHALGFSSLCYMKPLVIRALEEANLKREPIDFSENLKRFILMCLEKYTEDSK